VSLSLIVGPPNSGRTGLVRERVAATLGRDPVLVVPTLEDVARFERELCDRESGGAVLGVSILTFGRLFDEVARATGAALRPSLTRAQELHLVRRAIDAAELPLLGRSARRPGFALALAALIEELQASALDPASVKQSAASSDAARTYLAEIAALYGEYAALRDELGRGDAHLAATGATAALRARPDAWGARPVLLYGFDDMTVEQLELVEALARAGEVTATVTYEDRAALAARATLREELRARGGEIVDEPTPDSANTDSAVLFHLERSFLVEGGGRRALDSGLALMEAAGERGQAEQIGARIARLLHDGTSPDEVAVVLRAPDRDGPLYEDVLAGMGVPVAVDARIPARETAVGRGLAGLLRAASATGTADDVLAFLRAPGRAPVDAVDWLEREIRRNRIGGADAALEAWRGRELFELSDLDEAKEAGEMLRTIARLARMFAERPLERLAPRPPREERLELRAGAAVSEALEELAELPGIADGLSAALACLDALEVPLWVGPSDGHVRVTSPYRVRARRVEHLFVASLQEGEFPRHDAGEPLLGDELRGEIGLRARAEAVDEERYLFYVCLSRPTKALHLCWRSCDDEGAATARSPFLDDVRDRIEPAPAAGESDPVDEEVARRSLSEVTLAPEAAPTPRGLARALAARGWRSGAEIPPQLQVDEDVAVTLRAELDAATERTGVLPGPIATPAVLDALRSRELFGASTLEGYAECSYRWFVDHELRPRSLDPDPDPLLHGGVLHRVLEALYRDPPGAERRPGPDSVAAWRARAAELTREIAPDVGLGGADPRALAARTRIEALVGGFLEREANTPTSLLPDPDLAEASFGEGEDDQRPPLDMGGFSLHGKIDRVDVGGDGGRGGLIRDYKASRVVTPAAKLEQDGKLQLQLYAIALQRQWGLDPLGAIYEPLGATGDRRPRGLLRAEERDGALQGLELVPNDLLDDESFDAMLDAASGRAREIVTAMRAGTIDRDPPDDECPRYCSFQAICRRERGAAPPPDEEEEEEQ
jgi:ATP-dependent helicase/DNAse subunit B